MRKVLLNRIHEAINVATAIANRDLTQRIEFRGEDELAILARAFNIMADNLGSLNRTIHLAVTDIDEKAGGIISEVDMQADLSKDQSEQVSNITLAMADVADTAQRIADSAGDVVHIADETRRGAGLGVEATDNTRQRIEEIATDNAERLQIVAELQRRANQVGEVMKLIEQIADQTKLITFNASIEAASAGEMGRRLEVVAWEIRRLAENLADSAGHIRSRIIDIQQSTDRLVSKTGEESERVASGREASLHTVNVLRSISDGASKTTEHIAQISESIGRQNSASDELLSNLKQIERQSTQLKEGLSSMRDIAYALKDLSGNLRKVSSTFNIAAESWIDGRRSFQIRRFLPARVQGEYYNLRRAAAAP